MYEHTIDYLRTPTSLEIESLYLDNFKTFVDSRTTFGRLNILIGANASGKSNFLNALVFLRDLVKHGLDDAVSIQGGLSALRSLSKQRAPVTIGFTMRVRGPVSSLSRLFRPLPLLREDGQLLTRLPTIRYFDALIEHEITLLPRTRYPKVGSERLSIAFKYALIARNAAEKRVVPDPPEIHTARVLISTNNGVTKVDLKREGPKAFEVRYLSEAISQHQKTQRESILHNDTIMFAVSPIRDLADIFRYDVDPKLGKSAIPISGRTELEEDGDNLAAALRAILSSKDQKRELLNLVHDTLGFVTDLDVASFADMSRFLRVRESYLPRTKIPGHLLSDGTVSIVTLIVALFFQSSNVAIFEEPDRGLHPAMVRRLASLCGERSDSRQLFISTHSADLVDAVNPKSVLCFARDETGYSDVFRPSESSKLAPFVENVGLAKAHSLSLLVN